MAEETRFDKLKKQSIERINELSQQLIYVADSKFAALSTALYLLAIILRISQQAPQSILHYKGMLGSSRDKYVYNMTEISDDDLRKNYLDTFRFLSMKKNR